MKLAAQKTYVNLLLVRLMRPQGDDGVTEKTSAES
jgi:hypothetical protein